MRVLSALLSAWLLTGCTGTPEKPERAGTPRDVFAYDASKPLDVMLQPYESGPFHETWKLTFTGQKERVPGILSVPKKRNGKAPILLLLHGMGDRKESLSLIALAAGAADYATLALDAPLHGERAAEGREIVDRDLRKTRDLWVEAIVDYRRALDYLETREDVDVGRLVLLGGSMGGMMGTLLTAADRRIGAAVILVAGGDFRMLAAESDHPLVPTLREGIAVVGEREAERILSDIDPVNWVARISPRPLLFINGTKDKIMPKSSAKALIHAAGEPKTVIWDEVGHTIAPERIVYIHDWLLANTPPKSYGGE